MPKPYIVRLVFDRRHRSAVLWRRGGVIGGITYRPFYPAQEGAPVFAEIAFCAVSQSLQVSGFGTRLMNWAKHFALERDGCTHFLTYADNNAVGYFAKQGFSKSIALDRDVWQGYIKDYDGGTLMECAIHPRLPHVRLPAMLLRQKEAVESQVRLYSRGHVVHPGLHSWRDGARVAVTPESVPGLLDAGWRAEDAARERRDFQLVVRGMLVDASADNRQRYMRDLLARLQREPDAWPFLKPVPVEEVPDYYDVIKDPIDLSLIEARLESRAFYVTLEIFAADVARVFANAQVYNAADTFFHKIAIKLYDEFQDWLSSGIVYTS
ncbi:hypothetical protein H632_c2512p1 [Helicosporidium sp. ATCC 50920]|nr:hypothetical protein H632_c2512p1 [Helicosporidium sp. ATCC 50920]|eukprot:KDD73121.1 hypothetical protein H632_c2512p1 [Helicosporidium sp. ATCC 50920]